MTLAQISKELTQLQKCRMRIQLENLSILSTCVVLMKCSMENLVEWKLELPLCSWSKERLAKKEAFIETSPSTQSFLRFLERNFYQWVILSTRLWISMLLIRKAIHTWLWLEIRILLQTAFRVKVEDRLFCQEQQKLRCNEGYKIPTNSKLYYFWFD